MKTDPIISHFSIFASIALERFGYYGMRAILVLYFIAGLEEGGLGLANEQAYQYYTLFGLMIYLMAIPVGLVSDFLTGHRLGIIIGSITAALGMFIIPIAGVPSFIVGMGLVCVGSNFIRGNLFVLLGRHYFKWDNARDGGFTIGWICINIGAFLAPLTIGLLAEQHGWNLGFYMAGIAMLLCLPVFLLGTSNMQLLESDDLEKGINDNNAKNENIAPSSISTKNKNFHSSSLDVGGSILLFFLLFFASTLFWFMFECMGSPLSKFSNEAQFISPGGAELNPIFFQSLNPRFVFMLCPILAVLWYLKKRISPWIKMGIGLIVFFFSFQLFFEMDASTLAGKEAFWLYVSFMFLQTLAEILFAPIALSMATRFSPVRFSTTLFGVFIFAGTISHQLSKAIVTFLGQEVLYHPSFISSLAYIFLLLGAVFILLRKPLKRFSGGVG